MHLPARPNPGRNAPTLRRRGVGAGLLLAMGVLAATTIGLSMAGHAGQVDRWKRARPEASQTFRFGARPTAFRPSAPTGPAAEPSAVGLNQRPGAIAPEERRETLGAEGRIGELDRRGELARPELPRGNLPGRGPEELQRLPQGPAAQGLGQRGPLQGGALRAPLQGGQAAGSFAHRALAGRSLPGGFGRSAFAGRGPFAGRFQGRIPGGALASLVPRRPIIGERGFTGVPPADETRFLTSEMVFHVPPNVSAQTVDALARRLNLSTVATHSFNLSGGTLFRFRINDGRPVGDVIRALEAENVGVAQPNYVFRLQQDAALAARSSTGDPNQYVVTKLRLVDVHRIALGSNVTVAVIDSEIDGKHPELAGAVVDEFDAIGNHDKPHSHGTGMAGAIAAHRKLIGVAPGVRILAIHAFSSNGNETAQATSEHILAGIDWAIQKGAKIINMSFAGPDDPMLQLALQKARDQGIILIAAAGNMGPKSPPLYPAADPNVIAVTATDVNDQILPQANQGPYIAVAAPGVDILEPAPNGTYQVTTGTSVAAAHVSGIVALMLEHDPNLDANTVRDVLTSSAQRHTPQGRDDAFGYGIVDPYQALTAPDPKVARNRSHDLVTPSGAIIPRPVSVR
jgi:hypothetical protein